MRWIYISPHLDDAVLSAGGLIYEQSRVGVDVEIWTVFCGSPPDEELSPYAQTLHRNWGIPAAADVARARRAEDIQAAKIVGAKAVHFDFLDCIYRRGKNGDWLYSYIFTPPHEDEADFPARIAESVSARLTRDDKLVGCLGLGSHVDHLLARRAVAALRRPLLYYADVPYIFRSPQELASKVADMKENAHRITKAGLMAWQAASATYASQLGSLFDSPDAMRAQIRQYKAENSGVRLWSML